jgi:hypothetical protein
LPSALAHSVLSKKELRDDEEEAIDGGAQGQRQQDTQSSFQNFGASQSGHLPNDYAHGPVLRNFSDRAFREKQGYLYDNADASSAASAVLQSPPEGVLRGVLFSPMKRPRSGCFRRSDPDKTVKFAPNATERTYTEVSEYNHAGMEPFDERDVPAKFTRGETYRHPLTWEARLWQTTDPELAVVYCERILVLASGLASDMACLAGQQFDTKRWSLFFEQLRAAMSVEQIRKISTSALQEAGIRMGKALSARSKKMDELSKDKAPYRDRDSEKSRRRILAEARKGDGDFPYKIFQRQSAPYSKRATGLAQYRARVEEEYCEVAQELDENDRRWGKKYRNLLQAKDGEIREMGSLLHRKDEQILKLQSMLGQSQNRCQCMPAAGHYGPPRGDQGGSFGVYQSGSPRARTNGSVPHTPYGVSNEPSGGRQQESFGIYGPRSKRPRNDRSGPRDPRDHRWQLVPLRWSVGVELRMLMSQARAAVSLFKIYI